MDDIDFIKPHYPKGFSTTDNGDKNYPALGLVPLELPCGQVMFSDASGAAVIRITAEDSAPSVGVASYDPPNELNPVGFGFIVQMTPDAARKFGAAVMAIAESIEPGKPN